MTTSNYFAFSAAWPKIDEPRNLEYMRAFAEARPDGAFVQQAAAQMPWLRLRTRSRPHPLPGESPVSDAASRLSPQAK